MALPRTISGVTLPSYTQVCGPFRGTNGDHYVVVLDSTNTYQLEIWKADNGDNTWSEQDSANKPTQGGSGSTENIYAVLDGTDIHIVSWHSSDVLYYHKFSTSSDTWTTASENSGVTEGTTTSTIGLAVRSTGECVVVYQGATAAVMGTNYRRLKIARRSSAGSWTIDIALDDGGSVHFDYPTCVLGASDKVHIGYRNASSTNLVHKSYNSSNSLSAVETVNDTTFVAGTFNKPVYYDDAGTEQVIFSWRKDSDNKIYTSLISNDGTPGAETVAGDNATYVPVAGFTTAHALVTDATNDTAYLIYADSTNTDLYIDDDNSTGSGWGTDTSILTATINGVLTANVLTNDSGDIVLAYFCRDSSTWSYNEYVLVEGALTVNLTHISNTSTVHAPTVIVEPLISLTHISNISTVHALTATAEQTVSIGHIANSSTVHALTAVTVQTISIGHISNTSTVHSLTATAEQTVSIGHIASTASAHSLTATAEQTISIGHIASTATVHALTATAEQTISIGHIANSSTVHALTAVTVQTVSIGHISNTSSVYALQANPSIALTHISNSSTVHALTATAEQTISIGHIASGSAVYALTANVDGAVSLGHIASSSAVYALTAATEGAISLGHIASGSAVYALTATAEQTISIGHISSTSAIYGLTVTADQTISIGHIASGSAIYAPTVIVEPLISLTHISNASSVYSLSATAEQTISIGHVANASSVYALVAALYDLTVLPYGGSGADYDVYEAAEGRLSEFTVSGDELIEYGAIEGSLSRYSVAQSSVTRYAVSEAEL